VHQATRRGARQQQIFDVLEKRGKPMHSWDILRMLGRPVDRANRSFVHSTLISLIRKKDRFCKTAPNTFALLKWAKSKRTEVAKPKLALKQKKTLGR
jgi:hypothetical protein